MSEEQQPEEQPEERQPVPLAHSLSFGAGTFLAAGVVDLLAHLGPTGLVIGGIAAWVAARHGPGLTSQVREALPSPSSAQPGIEEGRRRGKRRFIDRALGRFPAAESPGDSEQEGLPADPWTVQPGPSAGQRLLPATAGNQMPQPRQEHRYRLTLGSHTLEVDTALGQTFIDEPLPEGPRTLTRILAEEFGGLRFTLVIVDLAAGANGFQSLLTEWPSGVLLGGSDQRDSLPEHLRQRAGVIDRGSAGRLGRSLIQERGQCIFRFGSFASHLEAAVNLLLFLQGIHRWEKEHVASGGSPVPCVIMLNQAHLFLPQDSSYNVASADPAAAQVLTAHLLHYLKERGAHGLYLYLISEYASRMRSDVLPECSLWLLREPQYEELYYLSALTNLHLLALLQQMPAEQALLLDVAARKSFPVLLRQSRSGSEMDALFPPLPPRLLMAALTAPTAPAPPEPATVASASSRVTTTERRGPSAEGEVSGEAAGDFSAGHLAYASYLYSTGRLTRNAVRRIPDQFFDLAVALGLDPAKEMNRIRARRLMGIVQGMGKEKRAKYARLARQHAAAPPQAALGGASIQGRSPPGMASTWELPRLALLQRSPATPAIARRVLSETAKRIARILAEYDVYVSIREEDCSVGHTITRYAASPAGKPKLRRNATTGLMEGVRGPGGLLQYERMTTVEQILSKEEDLALRLAAVTVRMARVPGRPFVGIEIPHAQEARTPARLRDFLAAAAYQQALATSKVIFPIGMGVAGEVRLVDLANPNHPHVLIGGASGGGKSVFLQAGITSIAMQATPDEVRMWLVDPKRVDFTPFVGLPHLIGDLVTEIDAIPRVIREALAEVERRYAYLAGLGVANLEKYQKLRAARLQEGDTSLRSLPELLLVIDELGDALSVSPQEVEDNLCRLGQLGRAAGLHLVLATQRPEVSVVKGRIKANLTFRVALHVSSAADSQVILDRGGAQLLAGRGDMLAGTSGRFERLQGALVEEDEAERVVAHWRQQAAKLQPASPFITEQHRIDDQPVERHDGTQESGEEGGALLQRVIAELPNRTGISVQTIKEEYHVSHATAQPLLRELLARRLIGEYNAKVKGHPVLVVNLGARRAPDQTGEEESLSS
jgi:FtsK/SpoIIIE family/FtsK alpha domain